MADQAEIRRQEYVGRINRVLDYVRENTAGDLRLETVARVANFSPYHFHRIFKAIVGETLNGYVRRLRAQRAASQLIHNPTLTITEIAVACGYSSSSAFSREFRQHFGVSATQFRAGGRNSIDRLREELVDQGLAMQSKHSERTDMVFQVEVREEPERLVAYVRHVGDYSKIGEAIQRLARWAGPRRLFRNPETRMLSVYHDNPDAVSYTHLTLPTN